MANHERRPDTDAHRKRKKGGAGRVLLVLLILLLAAAGAAGYVVHSIKAEISGAGRDGSAGPVTVEIAQGSGTAAIANRLEEAGVIRYAKLFRWYVGQQGAGSKLQYGSFTLECDASYDELIEALQKTVAAATIRVTFPEGCTALTIARKMEDAGLCTAEEFLAEACTGDFSEFHFWQYLPSVEQAQEDHVFMRCEGYLFPETYDFYLDDTVHNYVATFYAQFDAVITDEVYAALDDQGMTLHELVTLASIVQEEGTTDQYGNVAQVFRNRLAEGSPFPMLQSNTSSYIQRDDDNNYLWNTVAKFYGGWDEIPEGMVEAYDTYARVGLPAGPISNAGAEALWAALFPEPEEEVEDCYFFVTDRKGTYYYGHTVKEHNANCKKAQAVNNSKD